MSAGRSEPIPNPGTGHRRILHALSPGHLCPGWAGPTLQLVHSAFMGQDSWRGQLCDLHGDHLLGDDLQYIPFDFRAHPGRPWAYHGNKRTLPLRTAPHVRGDPVHVAGHAFADGIFVGIDSRFAEHHLVLHPYRLGRQGFAG